MQEIKYVKFEEDIFFFFDTQINHNNFPSIKLDHKDGSGSILRAKSAGACEIDAEHKRVICTGSSYTLGISSEDGDTELATAQLFNTEVANNYLRYQKDFFLFFPQQIDFSNYKIVEFETMPRNFIDLSAISGGQCIIDPGEERALCKESPNELDLGYLDKDTELATRMLFGVMAERNL